MENYCREDITLCELTTAADRKKTDLQMFSYVYNWSKFWKLDIFVGIRWVKLIDTQLQV